MKKVVGVLLLAVLALNIQAGKTIHIPKDAKNISDGLEKAEPGDTVFVSKGTYRENVALKDQVALIGESVKGTVIQGNKRGAVVKGADNAVIRNFTIKDGAKGILCENVTMLIEYNYVCDNKETGIHCLVTLPMIRNNVVYRNGWTGIFCETVKSLRTLIEHNVVGENGYSGIMLAGNSQVILQNNVFIGNKQFGIWVNEGARRSRIICNDFYMNRTPYNYYAQVDKTNLAVDPGYVSSGGPFGEAEFFAGGAAILKGKGKDGRDIGLISEAEMIQRGQDADNDGVPDDKDKCVSIPEDKDGFQDDDGCPDFDNDNDGLYDSQDKCPDQAEDMDGFDDKDGCPDPDNDKDGIPDASDVCPNNAETVNGYKDNDGCPDEVPKGGEVETGQAQQPAGKEAPAAVKQEPAPAGTAPAAAAVPAKAQKPAAADTSKKAAPAAGTTKKSKAKKPEPEL